MRRINTYALEETRPDTETRKSFTYRRTFHYSQEARCTKNQALLF